MKAALMEHGDIRVETIKDPIPQKGEILVRSIACGICGSDLHAARHTEEFVKTSREAGGAFKLTTFDPIVLGHEFCAQVVDYGPETQHSVPIDTLVCSVPVVHRQTPLPIGYCTELPGGFAEYMVVSENLITTVPRDIPGHLAALTEPMAVGLHAVNKAELKRDTACIVVGAGPVGLAVLANLKAKGVSPVLVTEYSTKRRELAERLGADITINPESSSPYELPEFYNATETTIFECVGVPGMLDELYLNARNQTTIVVVGVCLQTDHARPLIAVNKELRVQYVLGYTPTEFTEALHLIAEGTLDVEKIITHQIGLTEVATYFDSLASPEMHGKVIVQPWD